MQIAMETIGILRAQVIVNPANRQIHFGKSPCRMIRFLPVHGNIADTPTVRFDKFLALDEHST